MGGKTSTSTQKVKIPDEVLARYNDVNAQAQNLASLPFQQYSQDPNAFVAGLTDTQRQAMGMTADYGNKINGMIAQGTGVVGPITEDDINRYMSPYLHDVVDTTMKQLDYTQGQEKSNQLGQLVMNGAFGGDRGGIAAANLAYTQDLSRGSTLANLMNTGYNTALQTAAGQQGVQAANFDRMLQGAGLEGQYGLGAANALFGMGSTEQQTNQAGLSALYNQFLQQQAYPWQQVQFLANVAEGTGALSGSTTQTTTPTGFFSDRRLKTDIRRVGHTDDGLPIYKYKYKGDPNEQTHIGLMADEVEEKHPEAVGLAAGYKTVDYDKATPKADGGVVPGGMEGMFGGVGLGIPNVPPSDRQLMVAGPLPSQQSGLAQAADAASNVASMVSSGKSVYDTGKKAYDWFNKDSDEDTAYGLAGISHRYGGRATRAPGGVVPGLPEEDDDRFRQLHQQQSTPTSLAIPNAAPQVKPPETSGGAPKPPSTMDNIGKAVDIGKDIVEIGSKIIPMLLADGGVADLPDDDTVETSGLGPVKDAPVAQPAIEPTYENLLHTSRHAIGTIESSNNYHAVGPVTKRSDGSVDRPYGKYQVMGANIPQWTQAALGKPMTPEQFLASPEAQDAVFNHQFGSYIKKTGNTMDAASMWFTGRPAGKVPKGVSDVLGTTNPQYLAKFAAASGNAPAGGVVPTADDTTGSISPAPVADEQPSGGLSPAGFLGKAKNVAMNMMPSTPEGKLALLAGVFGMLASPNHYLLQAIGSGGLAGVQTYGDLIKLKNESQRNTMGIIQNRFATLDGKTYIDRYTGQHLTQAQYAAAVNSLLANSGIGSTGLGAAAREANPAASIVTSMPPVTTGAASSDAPVIRTAKEAVTNPVPAPSPAVADGTPSAAAGAPATNAPADVQAAQAAVLKDTAYWKDVPPDINAPMLFAQADEALNNYTKLTQDAQNARLFNPGQADGLMTQAAAQMERYKLLRGQAQEALNRATSIKQKQMEKNVDIQNELVEVQPTIGGPTIMVPKSQAIADAANGKVVIKSQNPIETETMTVPADPNNPTGPRVATTKGKVLRDIVAGNRPVVDFSPTQTDLVSVPKNPNDPTSPMIQVPKASLINDANAGNPRVTAINPAETETVTTQDDPLAPKVVDTKAGQIRKVNEGKKVISEPSSLAVDKTKDAFATDKDMAADNETRQPLINRVSTLSSIMEKYETGAWDTYKSAIIGQLRAAGFDVPQDGAADVQRIIKDSVKQVYDQAKQIGNKVLVAEIEGLSKTVPGAGLQPDANRALLAQMKGMLDWDQAMSDDYMAHRKADPSDYKLDQWKAQWVKDHPMKVFVKNAYKDIAPKGMSMPPMSERVNNMKYNSKKAGIVYWDAANKVWGSDPVPAPSGRQ